MHCLFRIFWKKNSKDNIFIHSIVLSDLSVSPRYYISKGAIIDQLGGDLNSTPLHWAIRYGFKHFRSTVRVWWLKWISSFSDPSPARQGHLPMVIQLMRYGADPSISDGEGYRGLHLAILFQHMAIAAYLMAKGQVSLRTVPETFWSD